LPENSIKNPRKQTNKAANNYSSKSLRQNLRRASRDHSLARSRRKRSFHKTLSPRERAALQTLKRIIPQKAKTYRYCTRFRMVGCRFPTHKMRDVARPYWRKNLTTNRIRRNSTEFSKLLKGRLSGFVSILTTWRNFIEGKRYLPIGKAKF
jgi:hypothetical protein